MMKSLYEEFGGTYTLGNDGMVSFSGRWAIFI